MPVTYTMKITTEFAAAHLLRGYDGPCNRMHGHNWRVEVEVAARSLDNIGMGIDFKVIKQATRQVVERLDHRNLNELPPFDRINPTAENIAAHLFRELEHRLNCERTRVSAVTLWETERACVRYTES